MKPFALASALTTGLDYHVVLVPASAAASITITSSAWQCSAPVCLHLVFRQSVYKNANLAPPVQKPCIVHNDVQH